MANSINGGFGFQNIGGSKPVNKSNSPAQPAKSESVQAPPSDNVSIGAQPVADAKVDSVAGQAAPKEAAPAVQAQVSAAPSAIPSGVEGLGKIAGQGPVSSGSSFSFTNGLHSTTLTGLDGQTIASVNPLKQVSGTKAPTTSMGVNSTFEMTEIAFAGTGNLNTY